MERLDPLFPPDDPRAAYVEVVPRRAWTDPSARRKLSDGGLLLIDRDSLALLYEGDRQRYVIPAAAVLRCEIEELIIGGVTEGLYAVVLMIRLDQGTHELPLLPLDVRLGGEDRWERALALRARILSLYEPLADSGNGRLSGPESHS